MKHASYLLPHRTPATEFGGECAAKIQDILAHPKPAGNWWAREIMSKVAADERVSATAYEMAKAAIGKVPEREPGIDWEEDNEPMRETT